MMRSLVVAVAKVEIVMRMVLIITAASPKGAISKMIKVIPPLATERAILRASWLTLVNIHRSCFSYTSCSFPSKMTKITIRL